MSEEDRSTALRSLVERVRAGDPRAIARALTWLESGADAGRQLANRLFPASGRAVVVGITGPPGAGKSTLANRVIGALRRRSARVAVVAVDPSSPWSHGALLGDRIRMRDHYTDPGVFIRSLASRGRLGGLADVARPAVRVLDAAGFDVVLVETVGIGQAEIDVARVADCVVFVAVPGAGDGVQAAKSGVLEVADLFVVNRADDPASATAVHELESVLHLRRGGAAPSVLRTTATTGAGTDELLAAVDAWIASRLRSGELAARRTEALVAEARGLVTARAGAAVLGAVDAPLPDALRRALTDRRCSPDQVAERLLAERLPAALTSPRQPESRAISPARPARPHQKIGAEDMSERIYWDREKETMPREQREAIVLERLRHQLADAYQRLPFYRRIYDEHGFHPDHVRTLRDFTERVPVITKDMLRADQERHPPFGSYLGVDAHEIARIHGSSGTSGKPTLYAISKDDWAYCAEVMAQGFFTCGVRQTDVVQFATVFSLFLGGWGSLLAAERIGATAFPLGAGETERQLELMHRVGSTVLITTPTYALHMLETARELGYDAAASPLRLGIFVGEPGSGIPGTRRTLEQGFGIRVRDCATTSEMTPWATNAECEEGLGVHVLNDAVWTEIVAKDDSNRLAPIGEGGAVVYTHLRRTSQPMIRFWCGDESRMVDDPCPCGRTYPRLPDGVYGRLDDMLLIRGANVYPSQVQRSLLEVPGAGVEFKIVLEREGSLDTAKLLVEYDPAADASDPKARSALADRVRRKLKNDTNVNFDVEVLDPHTLERAISKAQRVDDRRPKYRPAAASA